MTSTIEICGACFLIGFFLVAGGGAALYIIDFIDQSINRNRK